MKIGIDARNLVPQLTGIGRYILGMSRSLGELGHEIKLYLPQQPSVDLSNIKNAEVEVGDFHGAAARTLWGQTVLPRLIKRDGVDVLWGPAHRLPLRMPRRIARVLTIHDLVWVKAASTMHARTLLGERLFLHSSLLQADIIVADSDSTASDVRARFPKLSSHIVTIYPGADDVPLGDNVETGTARLLSEYGINRPFALFVGTREPRKNLAGLLSAYASLDEQTQANCMLVIVGGKGWGADDLEKQVETAGLGRNVKLLGYVSEAELRGLYASCRFVAMPSFYEGFGLPIVEANSFGAPALTSNTSSMPEIGGEAALLVDPRDVESMAQGFARLVNDDALHAGLARRARANARRFDWKRGAEYLTAVFNDAIEMRRDFG